MGLRIAIMDLWAHRRRTWSPKPLVIILEPMIGAFGGRGRRT